MANPEEFAGILVILTAAYPMFQIPPETVRLYSKELSDVPTLELLNAVEEHIKRCRFFPTIAELRVPFDEKRARARKEAVRGDGREWKRRIEGWKAEVLPKVEAAELLAEVNKRAGTSMESTSGGMMRLVKTPPNQVVGAGLSDEEWEEKKASMKRAVSGE